MPPSRPQTGEPARSWLMEELASRPPKAIFAPGREHIGDIVNLTGPLLGLRKLFPNARIVAEIGERTTSVIEGFPDGVEFWARPDRQGLAGKAAHIARLRRERFDLAVILDDSNNLVHNAWLGGIPRRVGLWRGKKHQGLYDAYVPLTMDRHEVRDHGEEVLYLLGLERGNCDPKLFPSEDRRREAREILDRLKTDKPLIGIQPGASEPRRRVPVEILAKTAKLLTEKGAQIVLIGSPAEQPILDELASLSGVELPRIPPNLHLLTLACVLGGLDLVICHDSGPMHMAAVMGADVLALYGPSYPSHTRPWGTSSTILQHPCSCENRHWTTCPGTCLRAFTPEEISSAAYKLVQKR